MGPILRLALFRLPDFRRLAASILGNSVGMRGETVVLGWLTLGLTNSPFLVGVAMGMRALPLCFVGVPAGALADRFPRHRLLMISGAGQAHSASTLGVLALAGHVTLAHVLLLTLAAGTLRGLEHAARQGYTHDVVGGAALVPGMAMLGVAMRAGWLVGSLGVGAIIARFGSGAAYLAVAAGFLAGALPLLTASSRERPAPPSGSRRASSCSRWRHRWSASRASSRCSSSSTQWAPSPTCSPRACSSSACPRTSAAARAGPGSWPSGWRRSGSCRSARWPRCSASASPSGRAASPSSRWPAPPRCCSRACAAFNMEPAMPTPAPVLDAIQKLLLPLLDTLERMVWVQRYLYPPVAARLAEVLEPQTDALAGPLSAVEEGEWPDDLAFMRERLVGVGRQAVR